MKLKIIYPILAALFMVGSSYADETMADIESAKVKPIDILLLNALPASGKSEARKFLSSLSKEECVNNFGIYETIQLDDFPYVHMMRRISDELTKRGYEGMFFISPVLPFKNPKEWGTLIHLVNEDYEDLINHNIASPLSVSEWLFDRLDRAREKVGEKPLLSMLDRDLREEIAQAVESDAKKLLDEKNSEVAKGHENKTIVIEFARGGAYGSSFPLPQPFGYQYSLSQLSPQILEKACILYIWVSPEESRRKNEARADPNDPGSILNHSVPLTVMYGDYGCDDVDYLLSVSAVSNTLPVNAYGKTYYLPLGRFDNRIDKTTFVRSDKSLWQNEDIKELHNALVEAFDDLHSSRKN